MTASGDGLGGQVDGEGADRGQRLQGGHGQHGRQQPVGEAVVVEDVGEAGGEDHAEAEVLEGPGGVLPAEPQPKLGPASREWQWRRAGGSG